MSLVNGCQFCLAEPLHKSHLLICRTLAAVRFTNLSKRRPAVAHRLDACKILQLLLRVEAIPRSWINRGWAKQPNVAVKPQGLRRHPADLSECGDGHVL